MSEYQQFFMKKLKGKISSMNYRQMLKKFTDISTMCFSPGNEYKFIFYTILVVLYKYLKLKILFYLI